MTFLDGQHRHVRMVLVDYIPYPTMKTLIESGAVATVPAELRLCALVKAAEANSWLDFYGVRQGHFHPRNLMVDHQGPAKIEVIIIDFSHAMVKDLPNSRWITFRQDQKPRSPMECYRFDWNDFRQWVPEELHERRKRVEWVKKQWGDSDVWEPLWKELKAED